MVPRIREQYKRWLERIGGTENQRPVQEMAEEIYDLVMKVNSRSVFLGCKYAIAQFLRQEPHPNGHRGIDCQYRQYNGFGRPDGQRCGILRFGRSCVLMTEAVALEQAESRIHGNAICPLIYVRR